MKNIEAGSKKLKKVFFLKEGKQTTFLKKYLNCIPHALLVDFITIGQKKSF